MSPKKDESLLNSISCNIRNLRTKAYPYRGGQTKCAKDFGVGITTWSGWESGRSIPSDAYQRELASFFSIAVGELRGEALPQNKRAPLGQGEAALTDEELRPLLDATTTIQRALQEGLIDVAQGKITVTDMAGYLADILAIVEARRKNSKVRETARITG